MWIAVLKTQPNGHTGILFCFMFRREACTAGAASTEDTGHQVQDNVQSPSRARYLHMGEVCP